MVPALRPGDALSHRDPWPGGGLRTRAQPHPRWLGSQPQKKTTKIGPYGTSQGCARACCPTASAPHGRRLGVRSGRRLRHATPCLLVPPAQSWRGDAPQQWGRITCIAGYKEAASIKIQCFRVKTQVFCFAVFMRAHARWGCACPLRRVRGSRSVRLLSALFPSSAPRPLQPAGARAVRPPRP